MERRYRPGTRIAVAGFNMDNRQTWEAARIDAVQREMLPLPAGYHPVVFAADGARLLVLETAFWVVGNR